MAGTSEFADPPPEPYEVPPPEQAATPLSYDDRPRGVKAFCNAVEKLGYTASATYARGWWAHSTQERASLKHSVVVRVFDDVGVVAVAWWMAPVVDADTPPEYAAGGGVIRDYLGTISVTDLKTRLTERKGAAE